MILSHGKQSVRVNALLDDASTTSYINTGVAAQLGVSGAPRRSTVSTLNGEIDTFITTPVTFHISSDDGAVQRPMTAYSTDKVAGSLRPVDWVQEAKKYDHLREIPFPDIAELKRLVSTERRLHKDENITIAYKKVVKAHEEKGYIRQLSKAEAQQKKCWYLPHFAIVRPQKTTTKVRIVFDAAANCGGLSLNDTIFPGTEAPTRSL